MSEHIVLHYYSDASNRVHNHIHLEYRNKIVTIIFVEQTKRCQLFKILLLWRKVLFLVIACYNTVFLTQTY